MGNFANSRNGVHLNDNVETMPRLGWMGHFTWRLAGTPTSIAPSSWKAMTEGVVRAPSLFSITLACILPSMMATHELVVPRSTPITSPLPAEHLPRTTSAAGISARGRPGFTHMARLEATLPALSAVLWRATKSDRFFVRIRSSGIRSAIRSAHCVTSEPSSGAVVVDSGGWGGGQHLGLGGQGEGPLAEGLQEHFDVVPRVSVCRLRGRDSLSTRALLRNACRPFLSAELFALGASLCGTGEEESFLLPMGI